MTKTQSKIADHQNTTKEVFSVTSNKLRDGRLARKLSPRIFACGFVEEPSFAVP